MVAVKLLSLSTKAQLSEQLYSHPGSQANPGTPGTVWVPGVRGLPGCARGSRVQDVPRSVDVGWKAKISRSRLELCQVRIRMFSRLLANAGPKAHLDRPNSSYSVACTIDHFRRLDLGLFCDRTVLFHGE